MTENHDYIWSSEYGFCDICGLEVLDPGAAEEWFDGELYICGGCISSAWGQFTWEMISTGDPMEEQ